MRDLREEIRSIIRLGMGAVSATRLGLEILPGAFANAFARNGPIPRHPV